MVNYLFSKEFVTVSRDVFILFIPAPNGIQPVVQRMAYNVILVTPDIPPQRQQLDVTMGRVKLAQTKPHQPACSQTPSTRILTFMSSLTLTPPAGIQLEFEGHG